ncbi:hypothetical protein [Pseudodesulfovibrio sp.]|uniref:hypothetical protein n=1 Tax=Pseudodesulfovibrio sp. TaxID=2035812 RepID=UPI002638E331|nr:hypothetical protein [Pseudodesulfovibrio sp.]MDD3310941.1 hypothetical protein [Pseudodesulfovibrio sp.]
MVTNEIYAFGTGGTVADGDVMELADYAADSDRTNGNQAGIARRDLVNMVLRQTSHLAAGLALFVAGRYASGVVDDGDLDAVVNGLTAAIVDVIENTPHDHLLEEVTGLAAALAAKLNVDGTAANALRLGGLLGDTGASPDSVMIRDGSGDSTLRYLFLEYLHYGAPVEVRATDGKFLTLSDDGYVRVNTREGMLASLQLLTAVHSYTAVQAYTPVTLAVTGGAATWDMTAAPVAEITLTGDVTLTVTNAVPGSSPTLRVRQDATGGWSLIYPSTWRWAGGAAHDVTGEAGAVDLVQTDVDSAGVVYAQGVGGYAEVV